MAPCARQVKRPRQHGQNPLAQEGKLTHSRGSLVTVKEKLLWHTRHCHPTLGHPGAAHAVLCAACVVDTFLTH